MTRSWHQHAKRAPPERRTDADGTVFDSLGELRRWGELQLLQRAHEIADLQRQVRFPLVIPNGREIKIRSPGFPNGRACHYTADFVYRDTKTGDQVVEEFKGHDTPDARLRRAVVEAIYNFRIVITGAAAR